MRSLEQAFTPRQYMKSTDFEFFHYKDEPTLEISSHIHDFYEIYFFISGKVNYIVEGKSYHLKPGDIFLINDKELHKPHLEHGCIYERVVIWVKPEFISRHSTVETNLLKCFDSTSKNKHNLLRPSTGMLNYIRNIISRLNTVCISDSFGNDILRNIYLVELLTYLNIAYMDTYKENIQDDIIYNQKVNEVIRYINDNLSEDLSLEVLSKKFYTSKYHLLRVFKKYTGYTPHSYALQKRLINAKTQLRDGCRISDIYQSCGFGDYSNFSRSFQKVFHMTPKQFRQSEQQSGG